MLLDGSYLPDVELLMEKLKLERRKRIGEGKIKVWKDICV
jgi:hypothetical protein